MKIKILTIILLLATITTGYTQTDMKGMKMPQKESNEVIYTCVMHPEIRSAKPGKCPKCGMELVKKVIKRKQVPKQSPVKNDPIEKRGEGNEIEQEKTNDHISTDGMPMRDVTNKEEKAVTANSKLKTIKAGKPRKIHYDLYVADTVVNYTGKRRKAIAINGTIPAPTLYFTQGDTAEISVHNTLKHETSIHWHGVILPNTEDGVSYLTTAPIKPGQTRTFRFPIVQNGTYWYHSHTKVQEQSGMYGALVFYKREEPDIKQQAIVLSDWADMKPHEIDRSLHNQTDWFSIRKNTVQSYTEAIRKGHFKTKVENEWKRMLAMDVSDVAYDRFLINGDTSLRMPQYKKGDKVKLRIVNGSSSTYFWLKYAGGKITVVANDGEDVTPVEVDRLIIAVAETYDVIITIPEDMNYEFLVTPEDRTKHSSIWLGDGMLMPAERLPKLKYFEGMKMMNGMMKMNGDMSGMEGMTMTNQTMDMNTVMYQEITGEEGNSNSGDSSASMGKDNIENQKKMSGHDMQGMDMSDDGSDIVTLNYSKLKAPEKTTLPNWPERTFYFNLTGNMNRYVWTIDNKTVSEAKNIYIKKGENIRIVMFNNTMMRHPMHLHGHFFRVLNGKGDYAPLKNVIDIMPMETDTLEFAATESGDWFFHCHILYHMMSGMGRVFSYENSPLNPELPNKKYAQRKLFKDDRMFHLMADIGLESNGSDGVAMLANTRWKLETMWHLGSEPHHGYESETNIGRYLGRMQWWFVYAGFDYHYKMKDAIRNDEAYNLFGQQSNKNNRKTAVAGIQYTLPMLIIADARIDADGKARFQLSREDIPISKRLRFKFMANTDREYMAGFKYVVTKYFSVSTHYDSDMGIGGGLTITY